MSENPWLQLDAFRKTQREQTASRTQVFHLPGVLKEGMQARLVKDKGQPSRRLLVVERTETAPRAVKRAPRRLAVCTDCHRHPCGCDHSEATQ